MSAKGPRVSLRPAGRHMLSPRSRRLPLGNGDDVTLVQAWAMNGHPHGTEAGAAGFPKLLQPLLISAEPLTVWGETCTVTSDVTSSRINMEFYQGTERPLWLADGLPSSSSASSRTDGVLVRLTRRGRLSLPQAGNDTLREG